MSDITETFWTIVGLIIFFFPLSRWIFVSLVKGGVILIGPKDPLKKTEAYLKVDSLLIDWKKTGITKEYFIDIFRYSICLIRFMLLVTIADGKIDPTEMEFIINYFKGSDEKLWRSLVSVIKHDLNKPNEIDFEYTYKTFIDLIKKETFKNEDATLFFTLMRLGSIDGNLDDKELSVIFNIMIKIGWSKDRISSYIFLLINMANNNAEQQQNNMDSSFNNKEKLRKKYLDVFNLSYNSDFPTIRKKYIELAKKYHPDRFISLGQNYSYDAQVKMKMINEAYNWLKEYYRNI